VPGARHNQGLTVCMLRRAGMTNPPIPRAGMILAACFQNFACGGLIFGWAAISSSLLIATDGGPGLSRGG
jgi:hypothetical protein